jgi:peptidyl-prolyl cis-trans isomerase SurA
MNYRQSIPSLLAALVFSLPLCPRAAPHVLDRVAALVNDEMIPLSEVYERAAPDIARLQAEGELTPEKRRGILKLALDSLIADRLLAAEQKSAAIEVSEQEIDYAIDDVRKQNNMDQTTFERALAAQGFTPASYRDKMRRDLAAMKLLGLKVRSRIKVDEDEVRAEYNRELKAAQADFEVHARHILVQVPKDAPQDLVEAARTRAADLARRARDGEDFQELARKHSDGPSKTEGGDVGFFRRGEMVPAFDQAAFSLEPGQISDPVRSPFGWHVIQVVERRSASPKPFDAVKDEIRDRLWREQMQKQTDAYVADLRRAAVVDVKLDELK